MGEYKRSEKTRRRIFRAAHELFFEKGYENTSLIEIAARAQVSTGTVYRHYPAKNYLLLYSAKDGLSRLTAIEEELPDDMGCGKKLQVILVRGLEESLSTVLGPEEGGEVDKSIARELHLAHRSAVYSTIGSLDYVYSNRSGIRDILEKTLEKGIERGEVACDVDARDLADILVAMYFRQCDLALLDPEGEGSMESFKHKTDSVLRLLEPEKHR